MCKKIIHLQRDQQKMILHWGILFAFFLIQPALLAPPPTLTRPESSLQFVESARQEDFLINGMADNGPKVGRSRMYYYAQNIFPTFCL